MLNDIADRTGANEDEFFYSVIMRQTFNIFSPFEIERDIDFPKKDELGGVVLKFIGGGAAYFKIQREMPSDDEVQSIFEVGKFLQESFGEYVELCILCTPDIEIRDIKTLGDELMGTDFVSARKNDGDEVLDLLIEKLENKEDFTMDNHVQKVLLPFMGRKNNDEFESKYSIFIDLFSSSGMESPDAEDLAESNIHYCRWFSDDFKIML